MSKIEISALIASHGREAVEKAIRSVLKQTLEKDKFEVIVVADKKIKVLEQFEDNPLINLKYINRTDPGGKWGEAIRISKGNVICFLDDDDEWVPEKLEIVYDLFSKNKSLGYYHNGHTSIDYDGSILINFPELRHYYLVEKIGNFSSISIPSLRQNFQFLSSLGAPFNSSCISLRSNLLKPYLEFLMKGMWMVDYFWFYSFAISDYEIIIDNKALTLYRRRNDATGDILNNIKNSRDQKMTIYRRYLSSHKMYLLMATNTPLVSYLTWMVNKTEIMLSIYEGNKFGKLDLMFFLGMIKNIPRKSYTGIFSTILLGTASILSLFSRNASLSFVESMEKLGFSLI